MNKMSTYIKVLVFLFVGSYSGFSQTANNTAGCAELAVEFTAPQAPSYFWSFGDGVANSTLQNPLHSYVQPGDYTAQLFDQENGTQIGEDIVITVYPPISIEINADVRTGCAPMEVNFTSNIADTDIDIEDIVWTFGDGSSASGPNVNYTYPEDGVYTVSIKVIASDSIKCDEPVIFEDYIVLEGQKTEFIINKYTSCELPTDFIFTNTTDAQEGTTYFWDFGNGQTITGEGPHVVTYDSEGLFYPELTSTSPSGCISSRVRTISLGSPIITPTFPDTMCLGVETRFNQSTIAEDFTWDFTGTSIDTSDFGYISELKRPYVTFTEPGLQTFTLQAVFQDSCVSIVTLEVFVLKTNASYIIGPEVSCTDPVFINYTADNPNLFTYTFNNDYKGGGEDIKTNDPTGSSFYQQPEHDEYHINSVDTLYTRLIVSSIQGCMDTAYNSYLLDRPEAFFIPDVVKGCIPFEVNFSDLSNSSYDIEIRDWDFGDGQTASYGINDTLISHTYNTRGLHEVILTITDENECVDISREVEIIAIEKIEIQGTPFPGACPEGPLCVGDSVLFEVQSNQVTTNLHIESDDGRFDHCWMDISGSHTFQYPGVFPIDATWEFLTIFIDSLETSCFLTIEGSRSDIDYFIDCANPYEVDFTGVNSINADLHNWYLGDRLLSEEESFTHTFAERGVYTVYLDTEQKSVGCTHRDSVLIHITDIKASIDIPEKSCVSVANPFNAAESQDVYDGCHAGYTWVFENQRPREVDDEVLLHSLLPGFQTVTLIVEDINGCKDTASATTTAYDLQADFITDPLICLPSELELTNLSIGDTTIMGWNWNFGGSSSTDQNPIHEFVNSDYAVTLGEDSILVTLVIEDVIGCTDSTSFIIETYDIFSEIDMDNGPLICQNEVIVFDAADYTRDGSFLTYEWDFGPLGGSAEMEPSVIFSEPGEHLVTLVFTEDATGCQGTLDTSITVTPIPESSFISNQDSVEFICFPEQFTFANTSVQGDTATYMWDFGNGAQSDLENPIIPFDKGTYEVELIVSTLDGCVDTFSQSYTLVGPEGNFTVDKTSVCPGEEITFTLENAVDVANYTWDFDDGVKNDNESPVTHTYDAESSLEEFNPTLILRSDMDGCELIQDIPITVSSITADFEFAADLCPGELTFSSSFTNPQSIEWNIDGQIITGTSNPSVTILSDEPTIDVILSVIDAAGCVVQRMRSIDNTDSESTEILFPNVFSPNNDQRNDVFNIVYDKDAIQSEVEVVAFKVYNRWGEILYDNNNPELGWNGTYKGTIVPADIYAYYIEVSTPGCKSVVKKGNVTVIK